MPTKNAMLQLHKVVLPLCLLLFGMITGCGGEARLKLSDSQSNPDYRDKPGEKIIVLAMYGDNEFEIRAMVENSFVGRWKQEGVNAIPGYRHFDQYDGLVERIDESASKLVKDSIDMVVFIDPIRAKAYNPEEYAARRSTYRALGMDGAAAGALIGQMAAEVDAAKFIMEVSVWSPNTKRFGWHGTYDINAPMGYDTEYAKAYSADFASAVADDLRAGGFLR